MNQGRVYRGNNRVADRHDQAVALTSFAPAAPVRNTCAEQPCDEQAGVSK